MPYYAQIELFYQNVPTILDLIRSKLGDVGEVHGEWGGASQLTILRMSQDISIVNINVITGHGFLE